MKKGLCIVLVAALLLATGTALAATKAPRIGSFLEVVNCKRSISLRWEPDTKSEAIDQLPLGTWVVSLGQAQNGFILVGSEYGKGWALARYLQPVDAVWNGADLTNRLTDRQRYNVNLFLSNFTEVSFAWQTGTFVLGDDRQMVDFAIDHIWFNQKDKLEWVDRGEYNVRLKESWILPVIRKYFDVQLGSMDATWIDRKDGYYWWTETGGHTPDGFAQVTQLVDLGDGYYQVYFESYGAGMDWTNDACGYTLAQARAAYPDPWRDYHPNGYAEIYAPDLSDRSTFTMLRYAYDGG